MRPHLDYGDVINHNQIADPMRFNTSPLLLFLGADRVTGESNYTTNLIGSLSLRGKVGSPKDNVL